LALQSGTPGSNVNRASPELKDLNMVLLDGRPYAGRTSQSPDEGMT
jgi:hypothetical protein